MQFVLDIAGGPVGHAIHEREHLIERGTDFGATNLLDRLIVDLSRSLARDPAIPPPHLLGNIPLGRPIPEHAAPGGNPAALRNIGLQQAREIVLQGRSERGNPPEHASYYGGYRNGVNGL